jgi:hypothetical protein
MMEKEEFRTGQTIDKRPTSVFAIYTAGPPCRCTLERGDGYPKSHRKTLALAVARARIV